MSGLVGFCRGLRISSGEGDYLALGLGGMTLGRVSVLPVSVINLGLMEGCRITAWKGIGIRRVFTEWVRVVIRVPGTSSTIV